MGNSKDWTHNLHVAGFVHACMHAKKHLAYFHASRLQRKTSKLPFFPARLILKHYTLLIASSSLNSSWRRAFKALVTSLMCSLAMMPLSKHAPHPHPHPQPPRAAVGRRKTTLTSGPEASQRRSWQRLFHFSLWTEAAGLQPNPVNRPLQPPATEEKVYFMSICLLKMLQCNVEYHLFIYYLLKK